MQELCEAQNDEEIRTLLIELPKDLVDVFLRIAHRIQNSTGGEKKIAMASKAFKWILGAYRPLRLDELREAMAIETTDDHLHQSRIPFETRLVECFGSFVLVDQVDRTVTFAHHTIQKFLLEDRSLPTGLHQDLNNAQRYLADACVTYLSFNDFETGIIKYRQPINASLMNRAVIKSSDIPEPARWLYQANAKMSKRNQPTGYDVQLGKLFERSSIDSFNDKYELLDYVIGFWYVHCRIFSSPRQSSKPEDGVWSRFRMVSLERRAVFPYRPWARNMLQDDPSDDESNMKLYQWALENDHRAFVELLYEYVENGRFKTYIEAASPHGLPLTTAYFTGAFQIAKFLWQNWSLSPSGSNDLEQLLIYQCAEQDSALVELCCKDIDTYRLVSKGEFSILAIQILCTSSVWCDLSEAGWKVACNSARGVLNYDPECTSFEASKADLERHGVTGISRKVPPKTRQALENALRFVPDPKLVNDCIEWAIGCDDTSIARLAFGHMSKSEHAQLQFRCIRWAAERRNSRLVQTVLEYEQCEPNEKLLHGCIQWATENDDVDLAKAVSKSLGTGRQWLVDRIIISHGHPLAMAIKAEAIGTFNTLLLSFGLEGFINSEISLAEDLCQGNALAFEVIAEYLDSCRRRAIFWGVPSSADDAKSQGYRLIQLIHACVQPAITRERVTTLAYLAYSLKDGVVFESTKDIYGIQLVNMYFPQLSQPPTDSSICPFTGEFLDWIAAFKTVKLIKPAHENCLYRYSNMLNAALQNAKKASMPSSPKDRRNLFQTAVTHGNYVFIRQAIENGMNPSLPVLLNLDFGAYPELAFEMHAMLTQWNPRFVQQENGNMVFQPSSGQSRSISPTTLPDFAREGTYGLESDSTISRLSALVPKLGIDYLADHLDFPFDGGSEPLGGNHS